VIEWINAAFTSMTGYTAEEAIGRTPRILKSGEQAPEVYTALWNTILAGKVWRGEFMNRRKDGQLYAEEQTITPVRGPRGDITHFVAIKNDVTERKRIIEALWHSEAHYRSLIENALDIILVIDAEGLIRYASPALERVLGWRAQVRLNCCIRTILRRWRRCFEKGPRRPDSSNWPSSVGATAMARGELSKLPPRRYSMIPPSPELSSMRETSPSENVRRQFSNGSGNNSRRARSSPRWGNFSQESPMS
jgi:PAS domain S-box-containing protein